MAMTSNGVAKVGKPVTVNLEDLQLGVYLAPCSRVLHRAQLSSGRVAFETLEEAFGPESLGIILVSGLPERFQELRSHVLSNASQLAHLPTAELGMFDMERTE